MTLLHSILRGISTLLPKAQVPAGRQVSTLEVGKDFKSEQLSASEPEKTYGPNYTLKQDMGAFVMISIVRKPNGDTAYRMKSTKDGTELLINRKLLELFFVKED